MNPLSRQHRSCIALAVTFLALLTACSHRLTAPKLIPPAPPAVPASPLQVAEYFQWCWRNRDPDAYRLLFTNDYRFFFATGDSAGSFYSTTPWTRSDELASVDHLFRDGTPSEPPAT